jgi:Zn-dependent metalloprotease
MSDTCGFSRMNGRMRNTQKPPVFRPRKYKSLYLGYVEVPPILETVYNGVKIKVIDVRQYNININYQYKIDDLSKLHSAPAKDEDAGIDIFYNTLNYLKYLTEISGRLNVDDSNVLISLYNVDKLENAFFTGSYMVYGDGDKYFKPLVSMDVVAHELTHFLCKTICNLEYKGFSGALNESFSDVIATGFEFWNNNTIDKPDFEIGEQITLKKPNLRDMRIARRLNDKKFINPNSKFDHGGVHFNSCIINHLFFVIVDLRLDKIQEFIKLWIKVYSQLPDNATFDNFKYHLRQECPVKYKEFVYNDIKRILEP